MLYAPNLPGMIADSPGQELSLITTKYGPQNKNKKTHKLLKKITSKFANPNYAVQVYRLKIKKL